MVADRGCAESSATRTSTGGGVKWHFLPTERLWLNAEVFRVNKAPYSGAFTPYTAGMTGWVPMVQSVIAF